MNISAVVGACSFFSALLFSASVFADHASAGFETGAAGAIMTTPGATLPKGDVVFGVSVQFIELDDVSDSRLEAPGAADEDVHSTDTLLRPAFNLAYGITDNLTLGLSVPYVERTNIRAAHQHMGMGEAEFAGDSAGIGDLTLFSQYRFLHADDRDMAVIIGIKTPTGDTDEKDAEGGLFEIEHQPGSGSWDPFFGLNYNHSWGRTGFSANVLYTITTEGDQQTELGDIFNYNLALSYRAFSPAGGHDHHHHRHAFKVLDYIDLVLELNGDHRGRTEIAGTEEKHSGGHMLYLSPGVRVGLGHRVSVFSSIGAPVVKDFNGIQSEPDYRVIGGMSVTF